MRRAAILNGSRFLRPRQRKRGAPLDHRRVRPPPELLGAKRPCNASASFASQMMQKTGTILAPAGADGAYGVKGMRGRKPRQANPNR